MTCCQQITHPHSFEGKQPQISYVMEIFRQETSTEKLPLTNKAIKRICNIANKILQEKFENFSYKTLHTTSREYMISSGLTVEDFERHVVHESWEKLLSSQEAVNKSLHLEIEDDSLKRIYSKKPSVFEYVIKNNKVIAQKLYEEYTTKFEPLSISQINKYQTALTKINYRLNCVKLVSKWSIKRRIAHSDINADLTNFSSDIKNYEQTRKDLFTKFDSAKVLEQLKKELMSTVNVPVWTDQDQDSLNQKRENLYQQIKQKIEEVKSASKRVEKPSSKFTSETPSVVVPVTKDVKNHHQLHLPPPETKEGTQVLNPDSYKEESKIMTAQVSNPSSTINELKTNTFNAKKEIEELNSLKAKYDKSSFLKKMSLCKQYNQQLKTVTQNWTLLSKSDRVYINR